jgi:ADP-ribosyl-[dinitrogen reductase] hydrolase
MSFQDHGVPDRPPLDRVSGCLLGGAVGDALGAPAEFLSLEEIRRQHGAQGIFGFAPANGRLGAITDDTQMTMWTAEGLLRACVADGGLPSRLSAVRQVYAAYLRWLHSQGERSLDPLFTSATRPTGNGWLIAVRALNSRRGPGVTCLGSLESGKMGGIDRRLNDSKGCGGVMRTAPVGLLYSDPAEAFAVGCDLAAITHGHASGYLSAGALATMIARLARGASLIEAVALGADLLAAAPGGAECLKAFRRAVDLAATGQATAEKLETLGGGWTGEAALAIAVYAALSAGGDLGTGVRLAVNHGGDSDSTGAICGNLLGASLGVKAIPAAWLAAVELRQEIEQLAADLCQAAAGNLELGGRYPAD